MPSTNQQFLRLVALTIAVSVPMFAQSLSFSGTPALGQAVTFTTTGTPSGNYALAFSNLPGPTPLPPLGNLAIGTPWFFLVGPSVVSPFFPALGPNGQATDTILIPNSLGLFGQTFYFQSVYQDPASPVLVSLTNGISFTIANPALAPTITSISPSSGGASGGTSITITGTNFVPGLTTVTLGGNTLGNLQVTSSTTITGTTPPGAASTTVALVVTTTAGGPATLASAYSYLPEPPTITSITPDHCQIGGGSLITITGTGIGAGTTIYFGGAPLNPITQTAAQVVAFAPTFNQLGFVDVVALSQLGLIHLPTAFRYTIALDTGTGADGVFQPTSNTVINTSSNFGVFNFSSVIIPSGITVTCVGPNPVRMKCTGSVDIAGVIDLSGASSSAIATTYSGAVFTIGGSGGPGGYSGGTYDPQVPAINPGNGPGGGGPQGGSGSYGTQGSNPGSCLSASWNCPGLTYGSPNLQPFVGGSGGGCSWSSFSGAIYSLGGGGGGGALSIAAAEHITVTGAILAYGGTYTLVGVLAGTGVPVSGSGSGGAVSLRGQGNIAISGTASVRGGGFGQGGNGRWFIENWLGQTASGTTATVPVGIY